MSSLPASFPSTPYASIGSAPGSYPSNRIMIRVVGGKFIPNGHTISTHITSIFRERQDATGYTWKDVSSSTHDFCGKKKRRVHGLGSHASTLHPDSFSSSATSRRTATVIDHVADERIRVLKEEIMRTRDNQERILQQCVEEEVSRLRQQSEEQFHSMQEKMRRMIRQMASSSCPSSDSVDLCD
ncbi:hypothetical protein GH714_034856 [Hevea brasiliensis]|uniref:Uncharacterized protein n=1 Tax=Hevea brasiliensis TaxID=3981 RepID=A0A6A6M717_HEVBR|nr:hypothetical protein GH714_034816 [Hevea brasiliensis]KAF2308066.1 hypothetical protein GH714_034856 [Hevea brasiliensis]